MTFSITHATRYVLLAAALATLGGCATPQQQAQMQAWQQIQAQQQALAQESGKIGAVLASDAQGRVVIGTLVPGAPSDQSGEVHTGDQLLAVAEGDGEPQSVGGKSMLEVRLMVQGEPNTPVSLVLAGQDGGDDRTVTLTRAEITPQQQQALAEIQQAEAQARELAKSARDGARWGQLVELELIQMHIAIWSHNPSPAASHFTRAIHLAAKRRIMRPFLDRIELVAGLVNETKPQSWGFTQNEEWQFFTRICERLPSANSAMAEQLESLDVETQLLESPTAREMELLALIEAGLSNQQLADRLSVSVSTVKWHLYNLYAKLGVSSRSAAVAKARALNLLTR